MSEEAEAVAPVETETPNAEAVTQQLVGGEDPMMKYPEKYRNEDGTENYDELVKGYNNLSKLATQKGLSSAPESADGYELADDLFEGLEVDEEKLTEIKSEAHKLGISNEQMSFFFEKHNASLKELASQYTYDPAVAETELKDAWGDDKFDANITLAFEGLKQFGVAPEEAVGNLALIKYAAAVAGQMQPDNAPPSQSGNMSTTDIDVRMKELIGNKDYYYDQDMLSEVKKLAAMKIANS